MTSILKRLLLTGLIVLVPLALIAIVLARIVAAVHTYIEPVARALPLAPLFPGLWVYVWAVLLLVVLCLVTGLVLSLPPLQTRVAAMDGSLARRFPLYAAARDLEDSFLGGSTGKRTQAALVRMYEAFAPAFVAEELPDGRYVVFLPAVPNPQQGTLHVVDRERVQLIGASASEVAGCIRLYGAGIGDLIKTVRKTT
jgi:uncharacterized membrane protein